MLGKDYKGNCEKGAIMEYVKQKIIDSSILESEISDICSKVNMNSNHFEYCSNRIGLLLTYSNNYDQEIVSGYCEIIEDGEGTVYCYAGIEKAFEYLESDKKNWVSPFII